MYQVNLPQGTKTFNSISEIDCSTRQDIATEFLRDLMVYNMTTEVEFILSCGDFVGMGMQDSAPFCIDDIENDEPYGLITINGYEHELTESERDEKLEFYEYLRDKAQESFENAQDKLGEIDDDTYDDYHDRVQEFEDNVLNRYINICDELEYLNFDQNAEVMQWFLCSDFLIRKLSEKGQVVLNGEYWGRQTYGQSIILDNVIQEIAIDWLVKKA